MPGDAERCLEEIGVDAVMSAEGLLSNPLLFEGKIRPCYEVAREYLEFADKYKPSTCELRAHFFRICHYRYATFRFIDYSIFSLLEHTDLRDKVPISYLIPQFLEITDEIQKRCEAKASLTPDGLNFLDGTEETLVDKVRKMPYYFSKPFIRMNKLSESTQSDFRTQNREELEKIKAETGLSFKKIRKRERRKQEQLKRPKQPRHIYPKCVKCQQPSGVNCDNVACRKCCRMMCIREDKLCSG
jgi:tRNA-dihydrouridine synthase 1